MKLTPTTTIPDKPDGDPVSPRGPKPRLARSLRGIVPKLVALTAAAAAGIGLYVSLSSTSPPSGGPSTVAQLRVSGNELVSASGQQVVLRGVDRSGTEYECVQGHGIFDGPSDQASISVMRSRGINAVRVPLNEACWNGESYIKPAYARRPLPGRRHGLRQAADRQRHGRDRGPALDRRRLHREHLGLLLRRGGLPEADARRGPGGAVLEVGGPHLQGQRRRSSSTCSTSPTPNKPTAATRPRAGSAGCTAAATAPAFPTGWPACRPWSTRSARPAPAT